MKQPHQVKGTLLWSKLARHRPSFLPVPGRLRGRRAQGVRYEKKVHQWFGGIYLERYVASPWFTFLEVGKDSPGWCQPDALLIDPKRGLIIIVEVKYQHTAMAYKQLKGLYLPVVAKAFGTKLWDYALCEVVKWYDPMTEFPCRITLKEKIHTVRPGELGVHICRPRAI